MKTVIVTGWLASWKALSAQEYAACHLRPAFAVAAILNPMGFMCDSQEKDHDGGDDEDVAATVARFNIVSRSWTGICKSVRGSECVSMLGLNLASRANIECF